jgi:hypothetical protein
MRLIKNNEILPIIAGTYEVVYSDLSTGYGFFNGNLWEEKKPVAIWVRELHHEYCDCAIFSPVDPYDDIRICRKCGGLNPEPA